MKKNLDHFIWNEKYRPQSIEDCVLPSNIQSAFNTMIQKGDLSHLLLVGSAGCGKCHEKDELFILCVNDHAYEKLRHHCHLISTYERYFHIRITISRLFENLLGIKPTDVLLNTEFYIDKPYQVLVRGMNLEWVHVNAIVLKKDYVQTTTLVNGNVLKTSPHHIVLDDLGREVLIKDSPLVLTSKGPVKIQSKELSDSEEFVYDIAIDRPHLYISNDNNVIHHNTTLAKAIASDLNLDLLFLNASEEGGIDILRNRIRDFCSTVSFSGNKKMVILDEMDNTSAAFQAAFRGFLEEFSKTVRFVLTCNFSNKIIEPIHSRCSVIRFDIEKAEKPILMKKLLERVMEILDYEKVTVESPKIIAELIAKHFPDYRRIINELQRCSSSGHITSQMLSGQVFEKEFNEIIKILKNKQYKSLIEWSAKHAAGQNEHLFRKMYDSAFTHVKGESIPALIILLAKYQYQMAFSVDPEICLAAFLTECMADIEFKE